MALIDLWMLQQNTKTVWLNALIEYMIKSLLNQIHYAW